MKTHTSKSRRPISPEVRLQLIEDCKTMSMTAAGKKHGLSITAARNALIAAGVPRRASNYHGGSEDNFIWGCKVIEALVALNDVRGGVSRDVVAQACGVSHERIRQIEESALRKIRVKFPEVRLACAPTHSGRSNAAWSERSHRSTACPQTVPDTGGRF